MVANNSVLFLLFTQHISEAMCSKDTIEDTENKFSFPFQWHEILIRDPERSNLQILHKKLLSFRLRNFHENRIIELNVTEIGEFFFKID